MESTQHLKSLDILMTNNVVNNWFIIITDYFYSIRYSKISLAFVKANTRSSKCESMVFKQKKLRVSNYLTIKQYNL